MTKTTRTRNRLTWRDKAYKVQCRLDYFLTSQNLSDLTSSCDPGSDHCVVKLFTQSESLSNRKSGPELRKFNASLLEDGAYINEFKENPKPVGINMTI